MSEPKLFWKSVDGWALVEEGHTCGTLIGGVALTPHPRPHTCVRSMRSMRFKQNGHSLESQIVLYCLQTSFFQVHLV